MDISLVSSASVFANGEVGALVLTCRDSAQILPSYPSLTSSPIPVHPAGHPVDLTPLLCLPPALSALPGPWNHCRSSPLPSQRASNTAL